MFRHHCELIVVDGGSEDATVELAKPFVNRIIRSKTGRAIQMNQGAQVAKGEWLIFLHADTLLPDDALAKIEACTTDWGRFDIQLDGRSNLFYVISFFMNWRSRITQIATGDMAIFVKRKLFEKTNGYPEIALMEDISLCAKLKKVTPPSCLSAKVVSSARRWERFGVMKTVCLMWSLRLRFFFGQNPETLSLLYKRGRFWKP